MEKTGGRNYGIDLLRMLSMLMIAVLHVIGQGGVMVRISTHPSTYYAVWFLETCAFCAVDIYGLISGYVGVNSRPRFSRILELYITVYFYSAGFTLLWSILEPGSVTAEMWQKSLMPVTWNTYWYFSGYFVLFFIMPFLNRMMQNLKEEECRRLFWILFIMFSVLTTIPKMYKVDFLELIGGYSFIWLAVLYVMGACLRKMRLPHISRIASLSVYFVMVLISWGSKILIENHTRTLYGEARYGRVLTTYSAPTILICALALLFLFMNRTSYGPLDKVIRFLSPMTFAVYIIHTQPVIWNFVLKNRVQYLKNYSWYKVILPVLGYALLIYCLCTLVELIRRILFHVIGIDRLCSRLDRRFPPMEHIHTETSGADD